VLANADLAEVMQHSGIPKFFQLVRVESNTGIQARIGLGDSFRQPTRETRHTLAVPAGGGIPTFNGLHTGGNKSFEQAMNFLVEIGIFDGDTNLMTECNEIIELVLAERFPIYVIDCLEHTQKVAMSRDGHTDHITRNKSAGFIHMAEETDIVLDIVDDNGLSGLSDVSRNALSAPETNLSNGLALLTMGHIEIQFAGDFIQQ
jgi:hypothetical protein